MGYLYSALWFLMAIVLLGRFRKESITIYILSLYFTFAGVWWLVDQFVETDMISGYYSWILRVVSIAMLGITGVAYAIEKGLKEKKEKANAENTKDIETGHSVPSDTEESVSVK